MFGNPETTTGGRALKFYSSVRLDIRRIAAIKDGDAVVGNRTKVKVVKNKVASPFREAEFDIIYGEGVSKEGDLLDLGVAQNLVEKSGSWFSYKGDRIGQGRENARQFLKDNPDIRQSLDTELRKVLGLIKPDAAVAAAAETAAPARPRPPQDRRRRGGRAGRRRACCAGPAGRSGHERARAAARHRAEALPRWRATPRPPLPVSTGFARPRRSARYGRASRAAPSWNSSGRFLRQNHPGAADRRPGCRRAAARRRGSTPTAPSIRAMPPDWAWRSTRLPLAQPDSAEQALEIACQLAASGALDLLVVDSAAALYSSKWRSRPPSAKAVRDCRAACWHPGCASWRGPPQRAGVAVVFLNQMRSRLEPARARPAPAGRR